MKNQKYAEYFLGANSPDGFHSYFRDACPLSDDWSIYIIKGGPGTGKSTLMRRLCEQAAERGLSCERICCSSDPDSLDGVIIPDLHVSLFDGTAPHVLEPEYPGVCENIINLGEAWSTAELRSLKSEIISCSERCSQHHAQATRYLKCADAFRCNTALLAAGAVDSRRVAHTADHLAAKYAGARLSGSRGHESLRLLSTVTPRGIRPFYSTLTALCDTIVPICDNWFAPSAMLMDALRDELLSRGCDIIVCPCSQSSGRKEHIIIPSLRTAFTVCSEQHSTEYVTERAVHSGRFMLSGFAVENRQRFAFNRKNIASFTDLAASEMRLAKSVHDELEQYYRSAMDFDAVDEIAEKAFRTILR